MTAGAAMEDCVFDHLTLCDLRVGIVEGDDEGAGARGAVLKNSLFVRCVTGVRCAGPLPTIVRLGFFDCATPAYGFTPDAKFKIGDPRFVDPARGDFRLGQGSPAMRAADDGTDLGWRPRQGQKIAQQIVRDLMIEALKKKD
jgi:hypothetical protein